MKFQLATALAFCLTSQTLAGPIALENQSPRSIEDLGKRMATVNTLPMVDPLCDGYSVDVADISAAVNQAANLMSNNVQRGKDDYPHPFNNYGNLFTWANCPPGADLTWYEFPVLRAPLTNPWLPGSTGKLGKTQPDRAIFQTVSGTATTVTYCGMLTHSGAPAAGQFIYCT